jgi:hypothetical protein
MELRKVDVQMMIRTQTFLIAEGTAVLGFLVSAAARATISDPMKE